ncbi:MAG: type II toxin-antitoxin system RelE/ParE family toxin [Deltaproteobacteria bacterium]|nr:type II toxin-antitoxin system RelE/ParE family toxin [Deltaproteobacteria bacterium]MBI4373997.1 type II toxin-antitoxin system RelE/ParE family toxin [Deltaproteobacteria bacterium]
MARKIIWTETAWSDLEEIASYITRDSVHYAAAFVLETREAAKTLATFSKRGHVVPEMNDPHIRELFVRSYRLIYQVVESEVHILGLIHGAMDLKSAWDKKERFRG